MPDPGNFFDMGGYAAFVWPAYGVSLVVLCALVTGTLIRRRRVLRQLAALERAAGNSPENQ